MLRLLENVSLKKYNTLAVNNRSRWLVEVTDCDELIDALGFAKEHALPLLLLGGGSNLVLTKDFAGLTVVINIPGRQQQSLNDNEILLRVGAGENWHQLVMWCVDHGFHGLENLALIPGTVGAAPIQNIGAYGVELAERLESVELIDLNSHTSRTLSCEQCEFGYRDSVFKNALKDQVVITHVTLKLSRTPAWVLSYPALQQVLGVNPDGLSLRKVAETVIAIRQSKLPDPEEIPNVGSFFKNPVVDADMYQRLRATHPNLVAYEQADGRYKLAAGWLLDQAGWKGKCIDEIAMHHQQALVLVNPNEAAGEKVIAFAKKVQHDIAEKYQVMLEIEPRVY